MRICLPAIIVRVVCILGIIIDIYIFGFYIFEFLKNVLFTIGMVLLTNWICYSWISWLIVIINILLLFSFIYLIKTKNTEIEKEKENRKKIYHDNNKPLL